jgi:hypothetical protein
MRPRLVITDEVEAAIKAELEKLPNASQVARKSKGAWSYSTVWRVADRAGIELTAGRTTMGRPRLPPECGPKSSKPSRPNPKPRSWSLRGSAGSAARRLAVWCARAARRRDWRDDALSAAVAVLENEYEAPYIGLHIMLKVIFDE